MVRPIFVSYRRIRLDWVAKNLLEPLRSEYGEERVFLDLDDMGAGIYYIHRLGTAIQDAKVFIPVVCSEYENSSMCQWEYHVALTSFLSNNKPSILPVLYEDVDMPVYKSMHHFESVCYDGWLNRLFETLTGKM